MNNYFWLSVPSEIYEAPVEEHSRILETARKRVGLYLLAYWTAMGQGLGLGLLLGVLVVFITLERSGIRFPTWLYLILIFTGPMIGYAMRFLNRRLMRRAVIQVLVEEGFNPQDRL